MTIDSTIEHAPSPAEPPRRSAPRWVWAMITLITLAAVLTPTGIWAHRRLVIPSQLEARGWALDGDYTGPGWLYDISLGDIKLRHLFSTIERASCGVSPYSPGGRPLESDFGFLASQSTLSQIQVQSSDFTPEWLAEFDNLDHRITLYIYNAPILNDELRHLARISRLPSLSIVWVSSDQRWATFSVYDGRMVMNLSDTRVTDAGVRHLADLPLLYLVLSDTAIGDESMRFVSGISTLRGLNVSNTFVTNAGIRHLARLEKLETLDVSKTVVTDEALDELRERLPDLKIFRE